MSKDRISRRKNFLEGSTSKSSSRRVTGSSSKSQSKSPGPSSSYQSGPVRGSSFRDRSRGGAGSSFRDRSRGGPGSSFRDASEHGPSSSSRGASEQDPCPPISRQVSSSRGQSKGTGRSFYKQKLSDILGRPLSNLINDSDRNFHWPGDLLNLLYAVHYNCPHREGIFVQSYLRGSGELIYQNLDIELTRIYYWKRDHDRSKIWCDENHLFLCDALMAFIRAIPEPFLFGKYTTQVLRTFKEVLPQRKGGNDAERLDKTFQQLHIPELNNHLLARIIFVLSACVIGQMKVLRSVDMKKQTLDKIYRIFSDAILPWSDKEKRLMKTANNRESEEKRRTHFVKILMENPRQALPNYEVIDEEFTKEAKYIKNYLR